MDPVGYLEIENVSYPNYYSITPKTYTPRPFQSCRTDVPDFERVTLLLDSRNPRTRVVYASAGVP